MLPRSFSSFKPLCKGVLVSAIALQLCACSFTMPDLDFTGSSIESHYYPQCAEPFKLMTEAKEALIMRTAGYAAMGVAGAVLTGAITGADTTTIIIGAGVAAIGSGFAGYTAARQDEIADVQIRMASYEMDMYADLSNMSRIEMYSMMSLKCYIHEFKQLLASFKAHKITEEEFRIRNEEIHNALEQIGCILVESQEESKERSQEFEEAIRSEREVQEKTITQKQAAARERAKAKNEKKSTKRNKRVESLASLDAVQRMANNRYKNAQKDSAAYEKITKTKSEKIKTAVASQKALKGSNVNTLTKSLDHEYTRANSDIENTSALYTRTMELMQESASKAGIGVVFLNTNTTIAGL